MGNNIAFSIYCNYRIAATVYYPRNTVCVRYIIVNTLHESDKEVVVVVVVVVIMISSAPCLMQ